jgi:Tfp pilus assembly protein PilZ
VTERRKFLRFSSNVGIEYRINKEKEICGSSYIKDLSREGLRFLIPRQVENGTMLDLKFLLPGDTKPIFITGEVVWINKYEEMKDRGYAVGVKFYKIDTFDRMRLLDHAYSEWLKSSKLPQ